MWSMGVVIGYIPILLMASLVPGFAIAFWDSIPFCLMSKLQTSLPIPWPWRVNFTPLLSGEAVRGVLMGFCIYRDGCFWRVDHLLDSLAKASAETCFSCSGCLLFFGTPICALCVFPCGHPSLGSRNFPFLIGCLLLLSRSLPNSSGLLPFCLELQALVVHPIHPGWQCRASTQCVNVEISGSNFEVDPFTADDISLLRRLAGKYASDGQSFVATPFWPGAYALLQRKSPMWEIYALFPRQQGFEQAEIERIRCNAEICHRFRPAIGRAR